jgi:starch synthase
MAGYSQRPVVQLAATTRLKICLASAEVTPLAKTGGLADVSSALSAYLHRAGHDVRMLIPLYSSIDTAGLEIAQVPQLQRIPIRIGAREYHFSIDRTTLPRTDLAIYLLRCPELYDRRGIYTSGADEHLRFILLSRAAIVMCQHMGFAPDIFHCHDWHAALIPLYLKTIYAWDRLFEHTRSVLTIHNIGYQGQFPADVLQDLDLGDAWHMLHQDDLAHGRINFLKTGVLHAQLLTTVSPTYAREIQEGEYGMGLQGLLSARSDSLIGILNGVDYEEWNPETDPLIQRRYSSRDLRGKAVCKKVLMQALGLAGGAERPLIGIVTRLAGQKGVDLMENVLPALLGKREVAFAVLGSGEARYERFFERLQQAFPDRVSFYRGYNNPLAHRIEAGSDLFLMPSLYEPCGLNQMYSLKYGTVPVVRETGGLADSVEQIDADTRTGTGILFRDYNDTGLSWALNTALDLYEDRTLWRRIMRNGMARDFSWDRQGEQYVELFRALCDAQDR